MCEVGKVEAGVTGWLDLLSPFCPSRLFVRCRRLRGCARTPWGLLFRRGGVEHDQHGFQAVQFRRRLDHDVLVDVAFFDPDHFPHRQALWVDLVQARSHDQVSLRHRLPVHHVVKPAKVAAVAFQNALDPTLLQGATHTAAGTGIACRTPRVSWPAGIVGVDR